MDGCRDGWMGGQTDKWLIRNTHTYTEFLTLILNQCAQERKIELPIQGA